MKPLSVSVCQLVVLASTVLSCSGGEELCFRARPLRCPTAMSTFRQAPDYVNAYRRISQPLPTFVRSYQHYGVVQPRPQNLPPARFPASYHQRLVTPAPFAQGSYCQPVSAARR